MPLLEICDDNGCLKELAPVIVSAAMLYPTNADRRDQVFAKGYVDVFLKEGKPQPWTFEQQLEILRLEHEGPDFDRLALEAEDRGWPGQVTGFVLLFILRCSEHRPKDASIRKAIHVVARDLAGRPSRTGQKTKAAISAIWDAWSEYRPVCHLWGASQIFGSDKNTLDDNLHDFLGTAEWLRLFAESHCPPPLTKKSHPLLATDEAWAVPPELSIAAIRYHSPPLSDDENRWLDEYRAT